MRWGVQSEEQVAATAVASPSVRFLLRGRLIRLLLIGGVCCAWFGGISFRLWDLQVRQNDSYSNRAERQQQGVISIRASRGRIFDRHGVELALSTPASSIGVFPKQVADPRWMASILAPVLDEPAGAIEDKLRQEKFQWLRRLADPGVTERLRELNLKALHFEQETKRYYPKGALAAHILGFVDIDHKGLAGLELLYGDELAGRNGARVVHYDALRNSYDHSISEPPIPGESIYLTIDERIQSVAEKSLAAAIRETGARKGSVIVADPDQGDILAMASWPTFDPNHRALDGKDWNYAIRERYEPGSTFKIVTVAAALESGIATPDDLIDCENGSVLIGRRRVHDHKPYDILTVSDVLANSSNVGVIKLGMRLGAPRLREFVSEIFHFGESTGVELPLEDGGTVHPLRYWRDGSVASVSMGHELTVTPLQMVQAMGIIANGGDLVRPRLVSAMDARGERRTPERPRRQQVLTATTAAQLRAMLERTVMTGTGRLAQTPGYRVGGKTGTAQMIDKETGGYSHEDYMASFLGLAPINNPKVVILVVLEAPRGEYYGGQVAAPVFREVASQTLRLLDVPPDRPVVPAPRKSSVPPELLADLVELEPEEPFGLPAGSDGAILAARSGALPGSLPREIADGPPATLRLTSVAAPDLRGRTLRESVAQASRLGLRLESTGAGVVVKQTPPAGTPMEKGSVLRLEFGRLIAGVANGR